MFSCNLLLHFCQNDWGLLCATVLTWGWNRYWNKSQHRNLTLEWKILPPLLKPVTFWSPVRHSTTELSLLPIYVHTHTMTHSSFCSANNVYIEPATPGLTAAQNRNTMNREVRYTSTVMARNICPKACFETNINVWPENATSLKSVLYFPGLLLVLVECIRSYWFKDPELKDLAASLCQCGS